MSELYHRAIIAKQNNNWNELYHCLQALATVTLEKSEQEGLILLVVNSLKEEDFSARWDLIKILPKFGSALIEPLIKLLEDPRQEVEVRWFVGKALSEFKTPGAILSLTKLLQTTEEETLQEMASQALAQIGASSIENLVQLLPQENLRGFVIEALTRIAHPNVIPYLIEAAEDPSPSIRQKAIEALSSCPDAQITPLLLKALTDPINAIKKEALIGLKSWCKPSYREALFPPLARLIHSVDYEVAHQAIINLALLGDDQALEKLQELLLSPFSLEKSKKTTIRALSWLEIHQATSIIILALSNENLIVVTEAITVLGRVTNETLKAEASQAIVNYYYTELEFHTMLASSYRDNGQKLLEDLKVAISVALGELGGDDVPKLLEVLSLDPQPRIRLHAITALKKLSC